PGPSERLQPTQYPRFRPDRPPPDDGQDGQTPRRGGGRLTSAAIQPRSDPAPDLKPVGSPASSLAARQSAFAAALGRQLPNAETAGRRGDPEDRARDAAEQL